MNSQEDLLSALRTSVATTASDFESLLATKLAAEAALRQFLEQDDGALSSSEGRSLKQAASEAATAVDAKRGALTSLRQDLVAMEYTQPRPREAPTAQAKTTGNMHRGKLPTNLPGLENYDALSSAQVLDKAEILQANLASFGYPQQFWANILIRCSSEHSVWLARRMQDAPQTTFAELLQAFIARRGDQSIAHVAMRELIGEVNLKQGNKSAASFALDLERTAQRASPDLDQNNVLMTYLFNEGLRPEVRQRLVTNHPERFLDPDMETSLAEWAGLASQAEALLKRMSGYSNSRILPARTGRAGGSQPSRTGVKSRINHSFCTFCAESSDSKRKKNRDTHDSKDCGHENRRSNSRARTDKSKTAPTKCSATWHNPASAHLEETCWAKHPDKRPVKTERKMRRMRRDSTSSVSSQESQQDTAEDDHDYFASLEDEVESLQIRRIRMKPEPGVSVARGTCSHGAHGPAACVLCNVTQGSTANFKTSPVQAAGSKRKKRSRQGNAMRQGRGSARKTLDYSRSSTIKAKGLGAKGRGFDPRSMTQVLHLGNRDFGSLAERAEFTFAAEHNRLPTTGERRAEVRKVGTEAILAVVTGTGTGDQGTPAAETEPAATPGPAELKARQARQAKARALNQAKIKAEAARTAAAAAKKIIAKEVPSQDSNHRPVVTPVTQTHAPSAPRERLDSDTVSDSSSSSNSDTSSEDEVTPSPFHLRALKASGKRPAPTATSDHANKANKKVPPPQDVLAPCLVNTTHQTYATVDSAAQISCIDIALFRQLKLPTINSRIDITSLDPKQSLPTMGLTRAELAIGTHSRSVRLVVMDFGAQARRENTQLLLGLDLMAVYGIGITGIPHTFPANPEDGGDSESLPSSVNGPDASATSYTDTLWRKEEQAPPEEVSALMQGCAEELALNAKLTSADYCTHPRAVVRLDTGDAAPVFRPQYPIAHSSRPAVTSKVAEWLENDVIAPAPRDSPWNSPLLSVKKRDANRAFTAERICIDPRAVNTVLADSHLVVPKILDLHNRLHGFTHASALDLADSYHQFRIHPDSQIKTTFTWDGERYKFLRAPFGFKMLTQIFQSVMEEIFRGHDWVIIYVDDVLVFSSSLEEHVRHLRTAVSLLNKYRLRLRLAKCKFGFQKLRCLGHIVSGTGRVPDPEKLSALAKYHRPTTGKHIEAFLGFCNYLRDYIPLYSTLAHPLERLRKLKRITTEWTTQCEQSYLAFGRILSRAPVIEAPSQDHPLIVATDASQTGIGAVLFQTYQGRDHYLCFASKSLSGGQLNYSATRRELLAIIFALQRFRQYLYGVRFELHTDHRALTFMFTQKQVNYMILNWLDTLCDYEFTVVHKPGILLVLPDALSRMYPPFVLRGGDTVITNAGQHTTAQQLQADKSVTTLNNSLKQLRIKMRALRRSSRASTQADTKASLSLATQPAAPSALEYAFGGNPLPKGGQHPPGPASILSRPPQPAQPVGPVAAAAKPAPNPAAGVIKREPALAIPGAPVLGPPALAAAPAAEPANVPVVQPEAPLAAAAEHLQAPDHSNLSLNEWMSYPDKLLKDFVKNVVDKACPPAEEREPLMVQYHLQGHFGGQILFTTLWKAGYYWPKMRQACHQLVSKCTNCLRYNLGRSGFNPMTSITAKYPFDHVALDLLSLHVTTPRGVNYILVLIDICTGFVILRALQTKAALEVARALWQIFADYGIPKIIQSDNGSEFKNKVINSLSSLMGVDHRLVAPYNPRANGVAERAVQSVLACLRKVIKGNSKNFDLYLPAVQMALCSKLQVNTKSAPASLFFARPVNLFIDYSSSVSELLDQPQLERRVEYMMKIIHPEIFKLVTQNKSKQADRVNKRRLVKNTPIQEHSLVMIKDVNRSNKKEPYWVGPYLVVRVSRAGTCTLMDSGRHLLARPVPRDQIKVIREPSLDKPMTVQEAAFKDPMNPNATLKAQAYEVERILGHKGDEGDRTYHVKWKKFPLSESTWEPEGNFEDHKIIESYWASLDK